jgi:beta-N-acetylhexosaminidase
VLLLAGCSTGSATQSTTRHRHPATRSSVHTTTSRAAVAAVRCTNLTQIASWSLDRRVEQLIVVPVQETDVQAISPAVAAGVGGVILYGDAAPTTLGSQLAAMEQASPGGVYPFVMTDEEGGEVQRMANLVGSLPWPRTMAETMTPAEVENLAQSTAKLMVAQGVTMDLAPVLDLASGPGPDALHTDGPRSFSPDPATATSYGVAFLNGLRAGGVVPVIKHFPGEGAATANTDDGPATTPPISYLRTSDLIPFKAALAAGASAVMVGNASVPGLTDSPASLSSTVIQGLLRDQLGFTGLIMTDTLTAGAITATGLSAAQASAQAIEAGADMVLFNSTTPLVTAQSIVDQVTADVTGDSISVQQLNSAVNTILTTKGVNLC